VVDAIGTKAAVVAGMLTNALAPWILSTVATGSGYAPVAAALAVIGDGDHMAALTDGTAVVGGVQRRWSTVGLYQVRAGQVAACWLLPLDLDSFDAVWAGSD
jgi:hypothetical protein